VTTEERPALPHEEVAEFLGSLGWRSSCDAQWTNLRDALPHLRAMLAPPVTDGGPAFPWGEHGTHLGGMTLRDYFAAKAMQAAITTSGAPWMSKDPGCAKLVSAMAYQVADEMLKARQS